jgi:hypothetical protein
MVNTLTVEDCIKQITTAKCRNKRSVKIKIRQIEFFKDKHPKIYLQTLGVTEAIKELEKMGYTAEYDTNDKQVSVGYDMRGDIKKYTARDLHTTSLLIKW